MLGNLLLLLLSWVLLKFSGSDLKVLGLFPTRLRSRQFFSGFLLTAVLAAVYFLGLLLVLEAKVSVNSNYSFLDFLKGSWWTIQSVLYEELLFRGALLFLALKYLGKLKGILLSATVFGIYHWFSYNVFGDLVQMIYTFILTGIGGFVFAYAYVRTKSLYLPIGLHFGWNFVTIVIFSQGIFAEDQLLISSTDNEIGTFGSIISLLYQVVLFPVFSILLIRFLTLKDGTDTSVRNDVLEIPSMD
ncbi:lysostaphin resistance A-like protein [Salinimicrobium sp. CAU 1759]